MTDVEDMRAAFRKRWGRGAGRTRSRLHIRHKDELSALAEALRDVLPCASSWPPGGCDIEKAEEVLARYDERPK